MISAPLSFVKRKMYCVTFGYMPLYREWSIARHSLAAIWKIDEPEAFFKEATGLAPDIKSEKRRMEHLAGRFLLKYLKQDFPVLNIRPDHHDKPRIDDNTYFFSISHSWPYVAAIISPIRECGIDIQTWHNHIEKIQHKFLSREEQELFRSDPQLLTAAWCAKEAAYKWQGRRGVDFITDLPIMSMEGHAVEIDIIILPKLSALSERMQIKGWLDKDFALAWVDETVIISNSDV